MDLSGEAHPDLLRSGSYPPPKFRKPRREVQSPHSSAGASRCSSTCCRWPANRIGYRALELGQLKILQEVITLAVFVPFSVLYMHKPLRLDFLWAGLCLCGEVYFLFRK